MGESYAGHFLHTLKLEESFTITPLSLTQGRFCHSHGIEALGSLGMAMPISATQFTWDLTHSLHLSDHN